MGFFNYVKEKKEAVMKYIDTAQERAAKANEEKLKALKEKRIKLQGEADIAAGIQQERAAIKAAKEKKFQNTITGRIATAIKEKALAGRKNKSKFGSSPFSSSSGSMGSTGFNSNPFGTEPKKEKKKAIVIRIQQ